MAYSPYQQEDYEVAWRLAEAAYYPSAYSLRDNDVDALGADIGLAIGRDALIQRWYVNNALRDDVLPPNNDVPTPRASLLDMPYDTDEYYEGLANRRFVFAGAGAASILLASYLKIRGASPDNITMVDPRGSLGGMWREQWAQSGGFNNPRALKFGRKGKLGISDREGWRMETFLQGVAAVHLSNVRVLADELATAKRKPQGSWRAITKEGTKLKSDYLVFAQGATEPRPIDGTRMRSNLDDLGELSSDELIIERHQRSLSEEELSNGRPIVLLGLGNSTIAMLRQIHEFEDRTLQTVPYVVVTHHSRQAVKNPTRSVDGDRPLFRNPAKSYLTGISGDIDRDAQTYSRMLAQELVVTDARTLIYDEADHTLNIGGTRINIKLQQPHLFALIGYQRDGRLFNEIDALIGKKSGEPAIRPCDGAVATLNEGYLSNVFAIGAVAASRRNPNAAVIPGIMAQVPGTVATIACRHIIGV